MEQDKSYEKAKNRAEAKLGFYIHLCIYIVGCIFFIVINRVSYPDDHWFWWPILGWGIGVIFHAMGVFVSTSALLKKMTEKELERQRQSQPGDGA